MNRVSIVFLVLALLAGLPASLQKSRSLESSDIQPPIWAIEESFWNASGCYFIDLEQSVEYDIQTLHVSSRGVLVIRDPSGSVVTCYGWRNPPQGGQGMLFEALSSGIHRFEIEGVCHLQVFRYVSIQVNGDATTLRGVVLDEKRGVHGYYVWVWQSGAEHPSDFVEVEVKLKAPEGADFNLCYADRFFAKPLSTKEETLVFGNGPEGLLLFIQRVSGEGEYTLTVRAYTVVWKALVAGLFHPATILVVGSAAILGIVVLFRSRRKRKE